MISSEVQRTLVKSPPELWAELSDPASLARHLSELGEVRVTRVEPERTVEWEAESASGKVELAPSGWGTKVMLSLNREAPSAEPAAEPEPAAKPATREPASGPEPAAESEPAAEPDPDPDPAGMDHPAAADPEPAKRRRSFFSRLFRRGSEKQESAEPLIASEPAEPSIEPEPAEQAPAAGLAEQDMAAELRNAEEEIAAQGAELLTGVLDRLGAAHHRPFSRS